MARPEITIRSSVPARIFSEGMVAPISSRPDSYRDEVTLEVEVSSGRSKFSTEKSGFQAMPFCPHIRFFLLSFFLFSGSVSFPQLVKSERYDQIDKKIMSFLKRDDLSIDTVSSFVNRSFNNTEDKVRAYYTFISSYVSYDLQRLNELKMLASVSNGEGELHCTLSQKPEEVFAGKKGVCEGISRLMVKFCESSKITAEMVVGHCKTPEGDIVKDMGHAWNAVKLDSAWVLLDITWSFGYVNTEGIFVRDRSDRYFCLKPEMFAEDHLPLDPMWQLCKKPVSRDWFFEKDSSLGKYYSESFNFNDSIARLLKKNEFERNYSSLLNYYRFDKKNAELARNHDVYVNNQAARKSQLAGIYYDDFVTFYNTKLRTNNTKANCKKALEMLNGAQNNLTQAQQILKNRKALTPEFDGILKKMNENMKKNMAMVNQSVRTVKNLQQQAK